VGNTGGNSGVGKLRRGKKVNKDSHSEKNKIQKKLFE